MDWPVIVWNEIFLLQLTFLDRGWKKFKILDPCTRIVFTKSWTRVSYVFSLINKESAIVQQQASYGKPMTGRVSFSESRACFSKRGAQHIPSLGIWLDLLHRHKKSATLRKSSAFVHAQHMETFYRSTGPPAPVLLLCRQPAAWLEEGQPRKMAAGAGCQAECSLKCNIF